MHLAAPDRVEHVAFPLRSAAAEGRNRQRVREALELVGLEVSSSAAPPSFPAASSSAWLWHARSSTRRRCCCSDEPLSNLDVKLREQMRNELHALQSPPESRGRLRDP